MKYIICLFLLLSISFTGIYAEECNRDELLGFENLLIYIEESITDVVEMYGESNNICDFTPEKEFVEKIKKWKLSEKQEVCKRVLNFCKNKLYEYSIDLEEIESGGKEFSTSIDHNDCKDYILKERVPLD